MLILTVDLQIHEQITYFPEFSSYRSDFAFESTSLIWFRKFSCESIDNDSDISSIFSVPESWKYMHDDNQIVF